MFGVLLRMADEAPPEYVAFVARHLEPLRRGAAGVVGYEDEADLLYPDVLTDVAARWKWLELLRTRLGRPEAADDYLHRAFTRRADCWRSDDERGWLVDVQVLPAETTEWPNAAPVRSGTATARVPSSAATRLAPCLRPSSRSEAAPLAEAAIAWWHAYEAHRRRLVTAGLTIGLVLMLLGQYVQQAMDSW
ncbi:MAG: hypothetical protein JWP76_4885 [Dactylosporangium sp.]|jgi:hypothetical protein|nr:hypothetical protein [Dactylosporangium sp.]